MAVFETSENAKDLLMQTHYYKCTYKQARDIYLEYLDELKHTVVSDNEDFCEVYSEVPHMFVVTKFFQLENQVVTAIDFYINAEYLVGNNKKALKFIEGALRKIESKYELKGVALNK